MSSTKKSKKINKQKSVLKSFEEIYIDYLNSSKSEDDIIAREEEFYKIYEKYDPDDVKPLFSADKIEAVINRVIENKDWSFLIFIHQLDTELFNAINIQSQIEKLNLKNEWYEYLKELYKDERSKTVIYYIKDASNEELFNIIFSESDIENIVKNNTEDYIFLSRQFRSIPSIFNLFKKYTTYGNKELDLICKTKENQYLPFESINHNVLIPITYYVNDKNPLHLIDSNSLVSVNSIMDYSFNREDYNIGLMNYLDIKGLTIDRNFFRKNQEFLRDKLTTKEIFMLSGYTFNGDVLVNLVLRMKADNTDESKENFIEYVEKWSLEKNKKFKRLIPIFYQLAKRLNNYDYSAMEFYLKKVKRDDKFVELIKECVEEYIEELIKIFDKAPALDTEMVVFRGVSTMYYKKDNSDIFYNNTFMSTSLNPNTALEFSDRDCCMKKIVLKPGFNRIIFMEPITQVTGEYELLICPDTEFRILKHEELKKLNTFNTREIKGIDDANDTEKYDLFVSEICKPPILFKTFTTFESV